MQLHEWQKDAVDKWFAAGCRGIIEAMPGAGKTVVGIEAIRRLRQQHGPYLAAIIVVPSVVIMEQWCERIRDWLPGERIGTFYAQAKADFSRCDILVAVVNSIVRDGKLDQILAHTRRSPNYRTLLIADECHHYVHGRTFGRITKYPFHFTMGLSATAGQWDIPGIGPHVCEYTFKHALRDGHVPRFHLLNVSADFLPHETVEYLDLTKAITEQFRLVKHLFEYELKYVPSHLLLRRLQQISGRFGPEGDPVIGRLFTLMFKRAELCYTAQNKQQLALCLSNALLQAGRKSIVFFERITSAETLAGDVSVRCATSLAGGIRAGGSVWCEVFHSQMNAGDRERVLDEFRSNGKGVLIACRGLDEGLDIPDVDAAILARLPLLDQHFDFF